MPFLHAFAVQLRHNRKASENRKTSSENRKASSNGSLLLKSARFNFYLRVRTFLKNVAAPLTDLPGLCLGLTELRVGLLELCLQDYVCCINRRKIICTEVLNDSTAT